MFTVQQGPALQTMLTRRISLLVLQIMLTVESQVNKILPSLPFKASLNGSL